MKPTSASNDFVVKFANVHGSGSASANGIVRTRHPEDGRAGGGGATSFRVQHQGLPTGTTLRVGTVWRGPAAAGSHE